jgi:hypothetical protein
MVRNLVLLWALTAAVCVRAELSVVYPANESERDTRFEDLILILRTALEKTEPEYGPFQMESAGIPMTSMRYSQELMAGRSPNEISWQFHGEAIGRARLKERRIIRLTNPLLPPETPLDDERLWFQPS